MSIEHLSRDTERDAWSSRVMVEEGDSLISVDRRRLQDFSDLSSEWFWEVNTDLRFTYLSDAFTAITGVPTSLVIGSPDVTLFGLSDEPASIQGFHVLLESRQSFRDYEFSFLHPDGQDVDASVSAKAIFDTSGAFAGYRGTGRKIVSREDSLNGRQESPAVYRLAEQIPNIGFWEWDEVADKCTFCSEELARIHGVSVPDYLRISTSNAADRRWMHVDDRVRYEKAAEQFRNDHQGFEIEYRLLRADGETIDVSEVVAPIVNDSGKVIRSFGFVWDISNYRRIDEQLLQSQRDLEARVVERTADLQRVNDDFLESQSWLRNATTNAKLGYFTWNAVASTGQYCDDQLAKILGLPANEWATETIDSYLARVHHRDVERVAAAFLESSMHRLPLDLEYRIVQPGGDIRYVHEVSTPELDEQGSVSQFFGTLQDVTDRCVIAEKLALVEERLHELGANAHEVLYVLSADWRQVLYVSKSFERIWGFSCEELIADPKLWYGPLHPEDRDIILLEIEKKIRGIDFTPDFPDCRIIGPTGTISWLSTRVYPIQGSDGEIVRFGGVVEDITERKAVTDALHQSKKMAAVGQLSGGVAHDFNNLLAVILGNAQLLKGSLRPEDEPLLTDIIAASERGAELTCRLLAFSRLQPLHPVMTEVCKLVTGMGELVRRTLGAAIAVEMLLSDCHTKAIVDPAQLENAILNLVLNARDATPDGGRISIEVAGAARSDNLPPDLAEPDADGYLTIVVRDNGAGMNEYVRSRALEPFFTTKNVGDGNGLGLSMVYGFAKQSKGNLLIDSTPGEGTAVTILLPCSRE